MSRLYDAVKRGNVAAAREILAGDVAGEQSAGCLSKAIGLENDAMSSMLVRHGVEPNSRSKSAWSDCAKAALRSKKLHDTVNAMLNEYEMNDQSGWAKHAFLLHHALESRNIDAVKRLIYCGRDINSKNDSETTPVLLAVEQEYEGGVKILLASGIVRLDIAKRDGLPPLSIAIAKKNFRIASMLMETLRPTYGFSLTADLAVDEAIQNGDMGAALALLEDGKRPASREVRRVHLLATHKAPSITGPSEEYLKLLCSIISSAETSCQNGQGFSALEKTEPDSDKTFLDEMKWLLECITSHPNCINVEAPLPVLPSRVLDVGDDSGGSITLVSGEGRRDRYFALSHRWAGVNTAVTTKGNLSQRLSGIEFDSLTKLMQDAVTITRRLRVRYLWIDALCIVQNSQEDWAREAANMAQIYRNAIVTIAAAGAADHSQGCFHAVATSTKGVAPVELLETRGWILQEQLLSRRILSYSIAGVRWDCISSPGRSEAHRLRRALEGFRSTSMELRRQAHASWQAIAENYSRRILTNSGDKLMAITGIASYIADTVGDEFIVGLWKSNLWRDLLWRTRSPRHGRLETIKLPSWTWASLDGPIDYGHWPPGSSPISLKPSISIEGVTIEEDLPNRTVRGELHIKGCMTLQGPPDSPATGDASPGAATSADASPPVDTSLRATRRNRKHHLLAAEQGSSKIEVDWRNGLEPDTQGEDLSSVWLLPVAVEFYWIYCLVLVPTERESQYRRVGRCYLDNFKFAGFIRGPKMFITIV